MKMVLGRTYIYLSTIQKTSQYSHLEKKKDSKPSIRKYQPGVLNMSYFARGCKIYIYIYILYSVYIYICIHMICIDIYVYDI